MRPAHVRLCYAVGRGILCVREIYACQLFRIHVFDLTFQDVLIFYVLVIDRGDCTSAQSAFEIDVAMRD